MKKTTLLLLLATSFYMANAQKATLTKPKQKTTADAAINPLVGSYKISRLATEHFDSEITPNLDSINAKMIRLTIASRLSKGETLTQADSTEIEEFTKNDTKFAFSFAYEFKANKTYVFSCIDNDKPRETKGTYNYNAAIGLVTIMYPKKPSVFMKYNKENNTIQNVVKKKEDAGTIIIFSKVDNKTN